MILRPWVLVVGLLIWVVLALAITHCDLGTAPEFRFDDEYDQ